MRPKLEGVLVTIGIATLFFLVTNLILSIAIYRNQLSYADIENAINNTIFIEDYEENN